MPFRATIRHRSTGYSALGRFNASSEVNTWLFRDWDKLLYGIHRGRCTLFLGPELPLLDPEGNQTIPAHVLAMRLLVALGDDNPGAVSAADLAPVIERFLAEEDEFGLEMEFQEWHGWLKGQQSTLHDDLAALPFRLIVNGSYDPLIEMALSRARQAGRRGSLPFRGTELGPAAGSLRRESGALLPLRSRRRLLVARSLRDTPAGIHQSSGLRRARPAERPQGKSQGWEALLVSRIRSPALVSENPPPRDGGPPKRLQGVRGREPARLQQRAGARTQSAR